MKFLPMALAQIGANAGRKIALGSVSSLLSKVLILGGIALVLAGCAQEPPREVLRIVKVPTSAPYKYITFSSKDDPSTILQIKRHNRTHSTVIAAEKNIPPK